MPAATDTLVGRASTDTLTNKTIALLNNTFQFNAGITTTTNSGSAGGTLNYINLGGIKIAWGISGDSGGITTNSSNALTVIFPTSFFSAQPVITMAVTAPALDGRLGAYSTAVSSSGFTLNFQSFNATSGAHCSIAWYAIGV